MSTHPVKLQINSVAALERLIGDDPELTLELRKVVVSNILSKSDGPVSRIVEKIQSEMTTSLFIQQAVDNWRKEYVLKPEHIAIIKKAVNETIDEKVWPLIHELLDVESIQSRIDTLVKQQTDYIIGVWSSGQIEKAIQEGVRQTLLQNLELVEKAKG
jgi:hypothetical protein